MEGTLFLSATEGAISEIIRRLIGEISVEEEPALLPDALNELLNVIVGNTTRSLDEIGMRIEVSAPEVVCGAGNPGRAAGVEEHQKTIETESGPLHLSFQSSRQCEDDSSSAGPKCKGS
jgi:CheY-specific phosphatase CheX